ncbi:MAG: DNA polymerase III subunit delta [bacterium]
MLVLLSGDDEFKKQIQEKELISSFDCDLSELKSIDNPSISELINFLNSPQSLFSFNHEIPRKAYLIKDFYLLKPKDKEEEHEQPSRSKGDEKLIEFCLNIIKNTQQESLVLFTGDSIKGTLKFVKELKKIDNCNQIELNKFKSWDLDPCLIYIKKLIKTRPEIKILDKDLELFIKYLGAENVSEIFKTLETLSQSFDKIDFNLLKKYSLPKYDLFSFAEVLILGKKDEAIQELRKIKADPEQKNNLGIIGLLHNQLNLYQGIKLLEINKFNNDQIAAKLGIKSGRVYHLKLNSKNIQLTRLEKLSEQLFKYEKRIKIGELKLLEALSLLVHSEEDQPALI